MKCTYKEAYEKLKEENEQLARKIEKYKELQIKEIIKRIKIEFPNFLGYSETTKDLIFKVSKGNINFSIGRFDYIYVETLINLIRSTLELEEQNSEVKLYGY